MTNPKTPEALADEAKRLGKAFADVNRDRPADDPGAVFRARRTFHAAIDALAALAKPQAVPVGEVLRDGACLYELNSAGNNRWTAFVQPGYEDSGRRTSIAECERIAAALSARPAYQDLGHIASAIHYPDCWDQDAYPTLAAALNELAAWFRCSNQDTHSSQPTEPAQPVAAEAVAQADDCRIALDHAAIAVHAAMRDPAFNEPKDIEAARAYRGNITNVARRAVNAWLKSAAALASPPAPAPAADPMAAARLRFLVDLDSLVRQWETSGDAKEAACAKAIDSLRRKAVTPAPAQAGEVVGKVLSEEEMPIGFDRRSGPLIWFNKPKPGYLYAALPAAPQAGEVVAPTDELLLKYLGAYLPPSPEPDDITDLRANVMALYAALHAAPIDMVLHCPKCGMQHIDAVEMVEWDRDGGPPANRVTWPNEPHRSHLCHGCGHIWRPADVETNGVAAVKTKGKADSPIVAALPAAPVAVEGVTELERWHKDVYTLIGHAEGLKAEGKRDMPAYFYDLAERLARLVGDAPMAERVAALSASLPVQPNED
jgi:hypothetical protein